MLEHTQYTDITEQFFCNLERVNTIPLYHRNRSVQSPFNPPTIVLIDPEYIVPHEEVTYTNIERVEKDFASAGMWCGQSIAIAGRFDDSIYERLEPGVYIHRGDLPDKIFGAIDGHHRRLIAAQMGIVIPAQIMPLNNEHVLIGTWPESNRHYTKEEVRTVFAGSKLMLRPKSTKFCLNEIRDDSRVSDYQPGLQLSFDFLKGLKNSHRL